MICTSSGDGDDRRPENASIRMHFNPLYYNTVFPDGQYIFDNYFRVFFRRFRRVGNAFLLNHFRILFTARSR